MQRQMRTILLLSLRRNTRDGSQVIGIMREKLMSMMKGTRNLMAGGDGVIHNGDDQKDMAGEDEDEDEKDVKERYGLRSVLAF